jgi:hypothetical protein
MEEDIASSRLSNQFISPHHRREPRPERGNARRPEHQSSSIHYPLLDAPTLNHLLLPTLPFAFVAEVGFAYQPPEVLELTSQVSPRVIPELDMCGKYHSLPAPGAVKFESYSPLTKAAIILFTEDRPSSFMLQEYRRSIEGEDSRFRVSVRI